MWQWIPQAIFPQYLGINPRQQLKFDFKLPCLSWWFCLNDPSTHFCLLIIEETLHIKCSKRNFFCELVLSCRVWSPDPIREPLQTLTQSPHTSTATTMPLHAVSEGPPARLANRGWASEPRAVRSTADRTCSSLVPPGTTKGKVTQQPGRLLHQHHPSQHHCPTLGVLAQSLTFPRSDTSTEERENMMKWRWALHAGKQDAHWSSLHAVRLLSLVSSQWRALLWHLTLSPLWLLLFRAHLTAWLQSGRAAPSLLRHYSDALLSKARKFPGNTLSSTTGKGSGGGKRGWGDYSSLASLCSALCVRRTTHYGLLLFLQFKSYCHKFLRRQQWRIPLFS